MIFSCRAPGGVRAFLPLAVLLVPFSWAVGCVGLTKPKSVQDCEKLPGGCVDERRPDAPIEPDVASPRDLPSDPETAKPDASPDSAQAPSDVAADQDADVSPDLTPDNRPPSDPVPGDVVLPADGKTDLLVDKTAGAEPGREAGPEPGAERGPEPGKEPGAEPSPEPGKEPGPEPGPEPGKEPGPEPPPEPGPDGGTDASKAACANATPVSNGNVTFGVTTAFCFVTCDTILNGWGCSSFSVGDRTVKVNGTSIAKCGDALPPRKSGYYYYFEIGPGGNTWDQIWWSGTSATSCPTPSGGFSP